MSTRTHGSALFFFFAIALAGCSASHAASPDAGRREDPDAGASEVCSSEGAVECVELGRGRECRGGVWEYFWDGPCWPPPPDAGVCISDSAPVAVVASASVRLRIHGRGWIVESGSQCGAYDVESLDTGLGVTLGIGFECVCECPAPGEPGPTALRAPAAGAEPLELVWDGRGLRTYTTCVDCAERGWPGAGWQRVTGGALQPTPAGRYRITIPVYDELPATCGESSPGSASCSPPAGPGFPFASYRACEAPRTVSVEVDLPESGEIEIDVDISPAP